MPTAPKKPCSHPGCPVLGECPTHGRTAQRKTYDQARGNQRGYETAEWKAVRALVLKRDPVCTWGSLNRDNLPSTRADCFDTCGQPSTTAAHIVPRAQGGSDEPENLRGLCGSHHSQETSRHESWNKPR